MWGCFDSCVGVLVICVLAFTVFFLFFRLYIFILICFVCTSVKTTATEWKLNCSNNNNNNNNNNKTMSLENTLLQLLLLFFFYRDTTAPSGPRSPYCRGFTITLRHTNSVGLLWTSDLPDAETSTWQHTALTTDKHPCFRRDSNPQSQQASGRRLTS
jgi:hypothetical protein